MRFLAHQFALQQVALPCLGYLQQLMAPTAPAAAPAPTEEQNKETKVLFLPLRFLPNVFI